MREPGLARHPAPIDRCDGKPERLRCLLDRQAAKDPQGDHLGGDLVEFLQLEEQTVDLYCIETSLAPGEVLVAQRDGSTAIALLRAAPACLVNEGLACDT